MALALPGEGALAQGVWPLAVLSPVPWIWLALAWRGSRRDLLLGAWLGGLVLWFWLTLWMWPVATIGAPMLAGLNACWPVLTMLLVRGVALGSPTRRKGQDTTTPAQPAPALRGRPALALALAPCIWVGIEHFRASVFLGGYAWGMLAHPLIHSGLAPLARFGGVPLVGLVACAFASALAGLMLARTPARGVIAIAALALILPVGLPLGLLDRAIARPVAGSLMRVGAVQTNVSQATKSNWTIDDEVRDYFRFEELTVQAAGLIQSDTVTPTAPPDLIVWPETMAPGLTLEPDAIATLDRDRVVFPLKGSVPELGGAKAISASEFSSAILALQQRLGVPMLVGEEGIDNLRTRPRGDGTVAFDNDGEFNSVYLLNQGAVTPGRYDKIELTPFGETMPVISRWEWLESQLARLGPAGLEFRLKAGSRRTVFSVPLAPNDDVGKGSGLRPAARLATPICFELTVPALCRDLSFDGGQRRADALVNLTNDAWFGVFDSVRRQHLQIARWRCVELGTPMVRAANTGISCVIDARGKVLASGVEGAPGATRVDGVLVSDVPPPDARPTLFARWGDWVGWSCLALTGLVALANAWRSLRR
jgi:apolipoprotein N-acyltransferase